jgi:hypothetical protein
VELPALPEHLVLVELQEYQVQVVLQVLQAFKAQLARRGKQVELLV